MKITKKFLQKHSACHDGYKWVFEHNLLNLEAIPFLTALIKEKKINWANWLIVRVFTHKQKILYAVYAAEQVLKIYERKYTDDKRPRAAIEAAKKCIKCNTDKNRNAADAAAYAADAAAYAAAHAAAYAADAAAYAAAHAAADAAKEKLQIKILKYGLKLLREQKK